MKDPVFLVFATTIGFAFGYITVGAYSSSQRSETLHEAATQCAASLDKETAKCNERVDAIINSCSSGCKKAIEDVFKDADAVLAKEHAK